MRALPQLAERPAVEPHQGVLALGVGAALLGLALHELEQTVHLALIRRKPPSDVAVDRTSSEKLAVE